MATTKARDEGNADKDGITEQEIKGGDEEHGVESWRCILFSVAILKSWRWHFLDVFLLWAWYPNLRHRRLVCWCLIHHSDSLVLTALWLASLYCYSFIHSRPSGFTFGSPRSFTQDFQSPPSLPTSSVLHHSLLSTLLSYVLCTVSVSLVITSLIPHLWFYQD